MTQWEIGLHLLQKKVEPLYERVPIGLQAMETKKHRDSERYKRKKLLHRPIVVDALGV